MGSRFREQQRAFLIPFLLRYLRYLKTWMAQIKNNQSQVPDNEEPEILTIALMQAEQTLQSKLYRKYAEQMERMYRWQHKWPTGNNWELLLELLDNLRKKNIEQEAKNKKHLEW